MAPACRALDVVTYFGEFPARIVVLVHIVVLRRRCMFASSGDAQTPHFYNALLVHHVPAGQADQRPVRALDVVIYFEEFPARVVLLVHTVVFRRRCKFRRSISQM